MSLFNELSQEEVIENIKDTNNYRKILTEKKEKEKTWKELLKEKKKELSPEEFKKRQQSEYYKRKFREKKLKKYHEQRAEDEALLEEVYKSVYQDEVLDYDKFYTEKYKQDDILNRWYNFAWWVSRLMRISWTYAKKQTKPFRISERRCMNYPIDRLFKMQIQAYEYLKQHRDEIKDCKYVLAKKQHVYTPSYYLEEPLKTIAENWPVNRMRIMNVFDWMVRWKFFCSELYLGRDSFILWDVLITWTWNVFRIALENNLPWLTKDTVEECHEKRMNWWKNKSDDEPPIYMVNDAYLIKIAVNERENLYYIVPM